MARRLSPLSLALLLFATGCDDRVALSANDVIDGVEDTTEEFPQVAYVGDSCSGTLISPIWASAAMTFSSVSVIGNALRLRRAQL